MNTQHFSPQPAHDRNVTARIQAAYAAAGIPAPTTFVPKLKRFLLTVPDLQQAAAGIAAEAYSAAPDADPATFWESAVDQVIRAQGADALKHALTSTLDTQERASGTEQTARALTDLGPWIKRQTTALVKAAKALPAGPLALDPEANLTANTGQHLTTARAALASLALYAALVDTTAHVKSIGQAHRVLGLIDPGNPTIEAVTTLGTTLNDGKLDTTRALRRIDKDIRTDADLTLVGIARGDYPGVTLAPATTPADVADRAARARDAFIQRTATEREQNQLIAMR